MRSSLSFLKPKYIFFIVLGYYSLAVNAQSSLPKVIPPGPETAKLFQFADFPVDNSSGLPQINIPLYEINVGGLNLPINLNYHSSGRKFSDDRGPIATDWVLNAGGMISRVVYGMCDELYKFPYPWKSQANLISSYDLSYLLGIVHSNEESQLTFSDSEYDIFSFSANQVSGKFIFKDSANTKIPLFISKNPNNLKIITLIILI